MNLRELSALLGLSQTTVSRALNGYPEVRAETRARVEAAARKHNYRPSSRAQGLATGRNNAIAHVIPVDSSHEMVNPVFADFIAGASEVYAESGFDMVLSIVRDRDEARTYREIAARHAVDGIIVHAPLTGDPRTGLLDGLGLPYVVHGRFSTDEQSYSWVDMNNRRAFERATEFLLDLGHRDILLLNGPDFMDFSQRRRAGFADAYARRGLAPRPDLIRGAGMTQSHGYETTAELLDLPRPPTAILASSLIIALGARQACHDGGLEPGREVSIVTHDDDLSYFRNGGAEPYFTALVSPVRDHGRRAARMLLRIIDDPSIAPMTELLEADLRVGRSTGPAPSRPALISRG